MVEKDRPPLPEELDASRSTKESQKPMDDGALMEMEGDVGLVGPPTVKRVVPVIPPVSGEEMTFPASSSCWPGRRTALAPRTTRRTVELSQLHCGPEPSNEVLVKKREQLPERRFVLILNVMVSDTPLLSKIAAEIAGAR
jgi:hypothetical protein